MCDVINWAKIASVAAGYYKLSGSKPVYRRPARLGDFAYPLAAGQTSEAIYYTVPGDGSTATSTEIFCEEL